MERNFKSKTAYKIFIFTLIISVIPMCIMNYIFCQKIENMVKAEILSSYKNTIQQYISNINYNLNLYDYVTKDIAGNAVTHKFLHALQEIQSNADVSEIRETYLEDLNKVLSGKLIIGLKDLPLYPLESEYKITIHI